MGTFRYAKKMGFTDFSISAFMQDLDLSKNMFEKKIIDPKSEVFFEDELPLIKSYLQTHPSIENLAILLVFLTGIRVGELATIKFEDIDNGYLRIARTESKFIDPKTKKMTHVVKNFPKSECGVRTLGYIYNPNTEQENLDIMNSALSDC